MRLLEYSKILSLLLITSLLISCSGTKPVQPPIIQTEYIKMEIPIQERPSEIEFNDVYFYVVTEDNLNAFLDKINSIEKEVVFFAITVGDYENLSLNMAEIKRYIEQQKSLIIYYENSINNSKEE